MFAEMLRSQTDQIMRMVDARIDGRLPPEERLRPPLAADSRAAPLAPTNATLDLRAQPPAKNAGKKRNEKVATKPATFAAAAATPITTGSDAPPAPSDEWVQVGKNGRPVKPAKEKKKSTPKKKRTPKKKKAPKLRPPTTAAVSITLQPGAQERGLTYMEVLKKIRADVPLKDVGLNDIQFRRAATGAYIFEIPGAEHEKADALAAKIKATVLPEDVKVARPMRRAEVRVSGLDESITADELISAVAAATGCPPDHVRTAGVRPGLRGLYAAVVSCPMDAAKKLVDGRRLLVGWVSAQVRVLPPRPRRCFRCLKEGHLGVKCTSQDDCSDSCYKCSRPGHKAGECTSDVEFCILCNGAFKPALHRLGGRTCPSVKPDPLPPKGAKKNTPAPSAAKVSTAQSMEVEEGRTPVPSSAVSKPRGGESLGATQAAGKAGPGGGGCGYTHRPSS